MNRPTTPGKGLSSVLIFSKDAKPHSGGIAEYLHCMCECLGQSGVRTVLATPVREGGDYAPSWHEVHRLPSPYGDAFDATRPSPSGSLFHPLWQAIRARRWARHWVPELIRLHSPQVAVMGVWSGLTDIWAAACRRHNLPVAYFAYGRDVKWHGSGLRARLLVQSRRRSLMRARAILAISRATADLVAQLGVSRSRIVMAPPGIDLAQFPPVPGERSAELARSLKIGERRVLLSMCRLVARKGVATMLHALPDVLREAPDCVYVIAGSGKEEEALRKLARDLNLEANVVFVGELPDDDKRALYHLCDVFVLPCRDLPDGDMEGFGIVFLEAAAYNKPVVAGRAGGVPDAVEDGVTGFLVDPLAPADVASAVTRLLRDRSLAAQLGRQGRQRAESLTWESSAATVREALDRLVR